MINTSPKKRTNPMTTWYREAQIIAALEKEAGWKENVQYGIMAAMVAVFFGSGIMNAAKKHNVSEEELSSALRNKDLVNQAKEIVQDVDPAQNTMSLGRPQMTPSPELRTSPTGSYGSPLPETVSEDTAKEIGQYEAQTNETAVPLGIDDFVGALLEHEDLVEKQTPFRYTSKAMRRQNTIHGFEIDKTSPRPKDRMNFIFLKNPEDVPKAVKRQLEKYMREPTRYNLSPKPTIEEALKKFDQDKPEGKMKYLKQQFPKVNFKASLSSLF